MSNFSIRPSRPLSCRKRHLCQGQARPGRSASLDIRCLASGQKTLRARNGNTSGGGSKQKQFKKKKGTETHLRFSQKYSFPHSCFCAFPNRTLTSFPATRSTVSGRGTFLFPAKFHFASGQRGVSFPTDNVPFSRLARYNFLPLILSHTHSKHIHQSESFVFSKSPGLSGQDGNCLTPIRILPKGLALWTPKAGTLGAGFSHPKGQKS
jgi:hypothetical protein